MQIWSTLRSKAKKLLISVMLAFVIYGRLLATKFVDVSPLEASIIKHEGVSNFVYVDSVGHYTAGIGRNLDKKGGNGLSPDEMLYLLRNDIKKCQASLKQYNWFTKQNNARKDALVELCFNMGIDRLLKFKNTIRFLDEGDYEEASNHLLNSKWAKQVGPTRSNNIARQIKTGKY